MPVALQPYLISEFKTGISTYLQPWIRPQDAFEPLVNAYVYRGSLNKRAGYSQFGNQLTDASPVMGIMQYIDETTGAISLLVASFTTLYLYDAGANTFTAVAATPTFTGNITNFFNWTNWQAVSGGDSFLWLVNNIDPVTNYNGAVASQPTITIDGSGQTCTTALDVKVYKQRLLLIRPTFSADGIQNQGILWSAVQNPTAWLTDTAGSGGFLVAPTGDIIQSAEFIRDVLVVFFTNSTWIFRFTGNDSQPFRWDKVNNSKSTNAPYASLAYDERCTSIGNTGLIACDGVNVQRYDPQIIDYYETNFSEQYYGQAFSQRYDNLNQSWTLYVSNETPFPLVGNVAPGSDSALVYNFLENTFATYTWSIPLTCLGLFYNQTGDTWADLVQEWQASPFPWNSYSTQGAAPIMLAGDTSGNIWHVDDETQITDNGITIVPDIITTRWNPILQAGQKVQFAYIDIYYYFNNETTPPISVNLNFFVDNSNDKVATRTLTFDGPAQSEYAFKRIYLNLIGEFFQMEIDPNEDGYIQFNGFILWCRPAGRLTGF